MVLVAFIAPGEHTALLIFAGTLLPISLWAGLWPEMLKASLKLVLPVAAALFVVQGLFFPGGGGVIPLFGPFSLPGRGTTLCLPHYRPAAGDGGGVLPVPDQHRPREPDE